MNERGDNASIGFVNKDIDNASQALQQPPQQQQQEEEEDVPEVDIAINNVVCSFSLRCHINLKRVALQGVNVIYKRENNNKIVQWHGDRQNLTYIINNGSVKEELQELVVNMKLRKPRVTANIWSSGKITCTGATSEEDSKIAARRVARILQKQGYRTRFSNFRVVNVLGTCAFPFGIKLASFSKANSKEASYEPELHPGVTYRIKEPKATLKVFSTGSITITAPSVYNLQCAVQHIFPIVYPYRLPKKTKIDPQEAQRQQTMAQTSMFKEKNYKDRFTYKKRMEESSDDDESFGDEKDSDDSDV